MTLTPTPLTLDDATSSFLALSGGTLSGTLYLNAGQPQIVWSVSGTARYAIYTGVGSNFQVWDYSLPGVVLDLSKDGLIGRVMTRSSDPTNTTIAATMWAVVKNTTSGEVRLWVNDGGTMKKSAVLT